MSALPPKADSRPQSPNVRSGLMHCSKVREIKRAILPRTAVSEVLRNDLVGFHKTLPVSLGIPLDQLADGKILVGRMSNFAQTHTC
jgi:hypothetical protein